MSDYKQTRDAAGKVTAQYEKMLRNLDDDLMKRLREHAHWGMTVEAADRIEELEANLANMAGLWAKSDSEKQLLLGRIEELEAQIKNDALQYLSDTGQMGEAVDDLTRRHQHALHKIDVLEDEIDELRAKLTTAVDALSYYANHDILLQYDDASFAKDTIATIK